MGDVSLASSSRIPSEYRTSSALTIASGAGDASQSKPKILSIPKDFNCGNKTSKSGNISINFQKHMDYKKNGNSRALYLRLTSVIVDGRNRNIHMIENSVFICINVIPEMNFTPAISAFTIHH